MIKHNKTYYAFTFSILLLFTLGITAQAGEQKQGLDKIGVQLYTLRTETEKDLENVLNKITMMGYEQVELHTLYNLNAGKVKLLLDKYRLSAPSTHRSYKQIKDDLMGTLNDARILGLEHVIIPWIDVNEYNTREKWIEFANDLDRMGSILAAHGVKLAYHNHEFEFKALADGAIPYDILIANSKPENLALQLDLFWITKAGVDPIPYIENNAGRIVSFHVKDMKAGGEMTEVGAGEIDFAKIFKVAKANGVKHFIVEHDKPKDAFASVESSIRYLKKMTF